MAISLYVPGEGGADCVDARRRDALDTCQFLAHVCPLCRRELPIGVGHRPEQAGDGRDHPDGFVVCSRKRRAHARSELLGPLGLGKSRRSL